MKITMILGDYLVQLPLDGNFMFHPEPLVRAYPDPLDYDERAESPEHQTPLPRVVGHGHFDFDLKPEEEKALPENRPR